MAEQPSKLRDYLNADDERPFLHKAFGEALDDAERRRYADLLAARDPARAEWLRLEIDLHARATDDPAVLARFLELAREIGLDFANLLLRDKIMNCGSERATAQPARVRFAFACTKRWQTLAPTDAEAVRFCKQCEQPVYRCDTVAEAETRAFAGQCIAVAKSLAPEGITEDMLGRPDPVAMWADRLFSIGPRPAGEADHGSLVVIYSPSELLLGTPLTLGAAPALTVGRGVDNDIVLRADGISRRHARLERRDDGWWVIDLDSTNGTRINGEQVREAPLRRGDRVEFGTTITKFIGPRR